MNHESSGMVERIEAALSHPLVWPYVRIVVVVYVFPASDNYVRALMLRGNAMLRKLDDEKEARALQEMYVGQAFDIVRRALRTQGLELEHLVRYRTQSALLQRMRPNDRPFQCAACGQELGKPSATGRPLAYCDQACRQAAYRRRAASVVSAV